MRAFLLTVVCGVLFFASPVSAELYRWVDANGRENFTNDPNKVPHEYRQRMERVEETPGRVSVGEKPVASGRISGAVVKEHRDKNGHGEEWWRRRADNLRRELRDLEDEYDLVLTKEREQEEKSAGGKKKKSKTNYGNKKMQLEKKIAQAKRRLESDLPEEARKADAYPGWIRE